MANGEKAKRRALRDLLLAANACCECETAPLDAALPNNNISFAKRLYAFSVFRRRCRALLFANNTCVFGQLAKLRPPSRHDALAQSCPLRGLAHTGE